MTLQAATAIPPEQPDASQDLRAAGALYTLLGRFLEREVDEALLEALRGPLREPLAQAGVNVAVLDVQDDRALLEALAEEYTCLLAAPGAITPYASVCLTGALFQEPCDRVAAAYREAGFTYQPRMSGEFPDHIGTMLAFLGVLHDRGADALESSGENGDDAAAWRRRREAFLIDELAPWAIGWARRATSASSHPLYSEMLILTEGVLWDDICQTASPSRLAELIEANGKEPPRLDYNADFRKASGL